MLLIQIISTTTTILVLIYLIYLWFGRVSIQKAEKLCLLSFIILNLSILQAGAKLVIGEKSTLLFLFGSLCWLVIWIMNKNILRKLKTINDDKEDKTMVL